MAAGVRVQGRRARRRLWVITARGWNRVPALWRTRIRRANPYGVALLINVSLAVMLVAITPVRPPTGRPEAPDPIAITVLREAPQPDVIEGPSTSTEDSGVVTPEPSVEVAESPAPDLDDLEEEEEETPPVPPQAGVALPEAALPRAEAGAGAPDGLIALDCYQLFDDPDKAAECAGREIRSGWQGVVAGYGPDWERYFADRRRGGIARPRYGPDELGDLEENEEIYQREDPRFRVGGGPGGRFNEAFESQAELNAFRANQRAGNRIPTTDNGGTVSYGTPLSEPLSGWQPSWMNRDDVNFSDRDLDELQRLVEDDDD